MTLEQYRAKKIEELGKLTEYIDPQVHHEVMVLFDQTIDELGNKLCEDCKNNLKSDE